MRVGGFEVHLLSDGVIKVDGGAMFGQVPRVVWEGLAKPDRRNRIPLGLNAMVVSSDTLNILVDTGAGAKHDDLETDQYGLKANRLLRGLRDLGLGPKDIHYVVLTHLHFDHAGGGTRRNRNGETVPTFPRARYLVQRRELQGALCPNERSRPGLSSDDFQPLLDRGQVDLLEGDHELAPGILVRLTGGHCDGHQIVMVNHSGGVLAFLGDLVPTPFHLGLSYISALDQRPEDTLEQKREILGRAEREGWLIAFAHGYENRAGLLERRDGHLTLRPVAL